MDAWLGDGQLYALLRRCDEDLAAEQRAGGCPHCGGVLHSARYPRKPRGAVERLPDEYGWRLSLCCAREGCRKRATPPSLRFLGRKVYLGPGGHLKLLHLWPGQIPPPATTGKGWIVTRDGRSLQDGSQPL